MALRVLYLGGTGVISTACVAESVRAGHEVTILNRGRTGTRPAHPSARMASADARDLGAVQATLDGAAFDVVCGFVAFGPDDVRADLAIAAQWGAHYVFVSSASAYQTPPVSLPVTESTPLANPFWEYSRNKIAAEDLLVGLHRSEGLPLTIVRPSHTYDATLVPFDGGWTVVDRMRRGLPVVVHGDGTTPWTLTWAADFATGFVGLLGLPAAMGRAVHITSDEAPTWNAIYGQVGAAAGVEPTLVHVPSEAIAAVDRHWGDALLGDKAHAMIFDNSLVRSLVPGFRCRMPFARGAEEIVAWHDADPSRQVVDDRVNALQDELVARFRV